MSFSGLVGGAAGSAKVRQLCLRPPGAPRAPHGASHGARPRGGHEAVRPTPGCGGSGDALPAGPAPGSSRDAPASAAQPPPAPVPLPLPSAAAGSAARPGAKRLRAGGRGGGQWAPALRRGRHFESPRRVPGGMRPPWPRRRYWGGPGELSALRAGGFWLGLPLQRVPRWRRAALWLPRGRIPSFVGGSCSVGAPPRWV